MANPPRLRHLLVDAAVPIRATRAKEERVRVLLARLEETSLGREKGKDLAVKNREATEVRVEQACVVGSMSYRYTSL